MPTTHTAAITAAIQATAPRNAILSDDYRADIRALLAEGIVREMREEIQAAGFTPDTLADIGMTRVNAEYHRRHGAHGRTLGAVLWAIRADWHYHNTMTVTADKLDAYGIPTLHDGTDSND